MKKKVVIIGAGRGGMEVREILKEFPEYSFIGFYDELKKGEDIINDVSKINKGGLFINSIADSAIRKRLTDLFEEKGFRTFTLISKSSYMSASSKVEVGSVIFPLVSIGYNVLVKKGVLIRHNTCISHDSVIGSYSNISPGVTFAGYVNLGDFSFVGTGANIIPYLNIADKVYIGAGATVIDDISSSGVYVGVPAKKIR